MRRHPMALRAVVSSFLLLAATAGLALPASGAPEESQGKLQMYSSVVDATEYEQLLTGGYDVAAVEPTADGVEVELVLSPFERDVLREEGFDLTLLRNEDGLTVTQLAAQQAAGGFTVYRSWDEPGGIEDELRALADDPANSSFLRLYDIGDSNQGRDILAIRLTEGGRERQMRRRPAVLYQATTHAREWISTEVGRRLLHWFIDQRLAGNPDVRNVLETTQLWFIPVLNPDGYQYTFDVERLWRKNLHDNDGDGDIDGSDGVDLNRNYPEHWNFDDEGSSSQSSSETYRGATPGSEPETQADIGLFRRANFKFAVSYHSFGQLLLYTQGWQTQTPSADDPIYVALTGTDDDPAVPGFDPGVGADLYTTNGEFTDWAHAAEGVLAWTPELSEGCEGCAFVFPDEEALIQQEFESNLPFAVNVAMSADDPDDPESHAGIDTQAFYLDASDIDPWKSNNPSSDLTVDVSYGGGSSQTVEVLAKRAIDGVELQYRINGGSEQAEDTNDAPDGERFGGSYDEYYHYLRGEIPGIAVGDEVEYWFTGEEEEEGDQRQGSQARGEEREVESEHATFEVVEDADADVLILAAEDRTGAQAIPGYTSTDPATPNYLSSFEDAITAAGRTFDVYDVDALDREAPDHLGVLSHYGAVVWYTGNDLVTRELGWSAGNASRLANDLILEVRAYLNEGGKVLYNGQWAGAMPNGVAGNQFFDPVANERCVVDGVLVLDRCLLLSDKNDFFQYYLGAYIYNSDAGTDPVSGEPFPVSGTSDPYTSMNWTFNGSDSAQNQVHTASFITTSSILPDATHPQFASDAPAVWETGAGGAFEPVDGDWYVYSQRADVSFKRLTRTIDLTTATAPTLTFRVSYDTEPFWDFVFVEAHTVGQDDWTTLADLNGHTDQETGESCKAENGPGGWRTLHPFLDHYQTQVGTDACDPQGTTGAWNASSGRSAGWEEWQVDLSAYAGSQVEVSISYASDWAAQGLGAFVDAIQVSTGEGSTSFETDLGGWTVAGSPPGSGPNPNDWKQTQSVGFEEGAVISTPDSLFFGFGLEGVTDAASRAEVMAVSLDKLLSP